MRSLRTLSCGSLLLLLLAGGCSDNGPATGNELAITVAGAQQASLVFDLLYCLEMKNVSNPSLWEYMIRFSREGEAFPGLQGNVRKAASAVKTHSPPEADTDITLNLTAGDVYVTGSAFRLTISEHTSATSMSGKMEVLDGKLHRLDDPSQVITISPTSFDFRCPCLQNADNTLACVPRPW